MNMSTVVKSGERRSGQVQLVAEVVAVKRTVTATAPATLTICCVETSAEHRKNNIPSLEDLSDIVKVAAATGTCAGATTGLRLTGFV